MTITTKLFPNLQSGIKAADDIRVRGPINDALNWLGEGLVDELNTHFGAVSTSISAAIATISTIGKHKIWVPVSEMRPATVNGPAAADVTATNLQYYVFDYDQTTEEAAHFNISMPSSWDEGTITYAIDWTAAAGAGDVRWALAAVARSNDDAIAFTFTTSTLVTDTLTAIDDLCRSPESAAMTIEGAPQANDTVFFRMSRAAGSVLDTLNADARLLGLELFITTAAAVDVA